LLGMKQDGHLETEIRNGDHIYSKYIERWMGVSYGIKTVMFCFVITFILQLEGKQVISQAYTR
jgi:hypothetical protein